MATTTVCSPPVPSDVPPCPAYRLDKSEDERRFVTRLDRRLMPMIMLGYYVKYLSQANISNAYVSGMKEDLNFTGDQYNQLLSCFTAGYVVGQFPATLLMVKFSPSIWLPSCELFWTILVMCCSRATHPRTLMGLRFFIGLAEASAYPGGMWLLGSWYDKGELGKRAVLFICSSSIGTMFSGYLQAAVLNLHGVGGLPGWAWLFIMDGVIALPICFAGYFFLPDTPDRPNPRARWLRPEDVLTGRARMARIHRVEQKGFSVGAFVQAFASWIPWCFAPMYVCYVLGLSSFAYMNLWLKSTGQYTVSQINLIPTGGYALQLISALVYSVTSDYIRLRWPVILFGATVALIGNVILAVWPVDDRAKFAGFFLSFTITPCGALTLSWANELISSVGAEHRAIVIGFLTTTSYVFNSWVPNILFPASKAPTYPVGYKLTSAFFGVMIMGTCAIAYLEKKEIGKRREREAVGSAVEVCLHELEGMEGRHPRKEEEEDVKTAPGDGPGEVEMDKTGLR